MKKGGSKDYNDKAKANNDLRSSLHYYLFIKSTEQEISQLVDGEWNRSARLRLHLCRSKSGEPLWASPKDMDSLIDTMRTYREMFNLVPAPKDYKIGDKVMLKMKAFNGLEFFVTKIKEQGEGASLTLELPILNGKFVIRTQNMQVARQYLPMKIQELLSPDYVREMEQTLVGIVRHRYGRRKKTNPADAGSMSLNDFQFFNYVALNDTEAHKHIRTLLLLCAVLRKDRRTVDYYIPIVKGLLTNPEETATPREAIAMAVLFMATQNSDYRTAAKRYEKKMLQEQADANENDEQAHLKMLFSQLMPVIKYIHFRNNPEKNKNKKIEKKVTKQVQQTFSQIRACDFSSIAPQSAMAVWDILALPLYDCEDGHALQAELTEAVQQRLKTIDEQLSRMRSKESIEAKTAEKATWLSVSQHFSGQSEPTAPATVSHEDFLLSRKNLLRSVRISSSTLASYYHSLLQLYPDRNTPDAEELYNEFQQILLNAYTKASPMSPSWWQTKSILEHYLNVRRQ